MLIDALSVLCVQLTRDLLAIAKFLFLQVYYKQGDHLSRKPGNVREFDNCQGNVRDFTESQGHISEKILSGKSFVKLFIVSCIFASIQVFSTGTGML